MDENKKWKMINQRKLVDEILQVRNRLRIQVPVAECFLRMKSIKNAYKQINQKNTELLRYFPIAAVTCIESYFQFAIKELIDSGEPFLSNARGLLKSKQFDFDTLKALHGQTISIGDVIAHLCSISSLKQVLGLMDQLMSNEFSSKVCDVHDRYSVEVLGKIEQPIIKDSNLTFRYVSETFQFRHIFCHEIATAIEPKSEDIRKCLRHSEIFLKASKELIEQTLYPDLPLTQTDMNITSYEDFQKEKNLLDSATANVLRLLSDKQKDKFHEANGAWEVFMKASIDIEKLEFEGGSISPTIANLAATRLTQHRKEQTEELINFLTS